MQGSYWDGAVNRRAAPSPVHKHNPPQNPNGRSRSGYDRDDGLLPATLRQETAPSVMPPPCLLARLLASSTGIEFGADSGLLARYDSLSFEAERHISRGGQVPVAGSTYSSVLSEIVTTPLAPLLLTQHMFAPPANSGHTPASHLLGQLQNVLDEALSSAPAVPYFREAVVRLTPQGVRITSAAAGGNIRSFLSHACEHSAACLESYANAQRRRLTATSRPDESEAARLSAGFAQLMGGFLLRKVRDTLCTDSDTTVASLIPWEAVREVREEPLATGSEGRRDYSDETLFSVQGLQASSPGRVVFTLGTEEGAGRISQSVWEAVSEAASASRRRGGVGIAEGVLAAIKGVLKHLHPADLLGCVLSGFVVDVQSKMTSDGILEGVRLMSAGSVLERAQIAKEATRHTAHHYVGSTPLIHPSEPTPPRPSREATLRELRRQQGSFEDLGGPVGLDVADDGWGGVHALEKGIHSLTEQKRRQREVDEEIQQIREREARMRNDIRPISTAGSRRGNSTQPERHAVDHVRYGDIQHSPAHNYGGAASARTNSARRSRASSVGGDYHLHRANPSATGVGVSPSPAPVYSRNSEPPMAADGGLALEQRIRQGLRDDALLRESSTRPSATSINTMREGSRSSITANALNTQDMYSDVGSLLSQLEREEKAAERGIRMQRDRLHIPSQSPYRGDHHHEHRGTSETANKHLSTPQVGISQEPTDVKPLTAPVADKVVEPSATSPQSRPAEPPTSKSAPANATAEGGSVDGPSPLGWTAKKDPATGRTFYSNKALAKSTWRRGDTDLPPLPASDKAEPVPAPAPTLDTHIPGEGWVAVDDKPTGRTFFTNKALNKSTWKLQETAPRLKGEAAASTAEGSVASTTVTQPVVEEVAKKEETRPATPIKSQLPSTPKSAPPPAATPPAKQPEAASSTQLNVDQEKEKRKTLDADKRGENSPTPLRTATGKSLADALREQQAKMEAEEKERGPRPLAVARGAPRVVVDEGDQKEAARPAAVATPQPTAATEPEPQLASNKAVPPPPKKSVPPPPPKKSAPPPLPKKSSPSPAPSVPASPVNETADGGTSPPSSPRDGEGATPPAALPVGKSAVGGGPGAGKIYGAYKEVYDPAKQRYYYRHLVTKVATWTIPDEVAALKNKIEEAGAGETNATTATTPSSPAPSAPASPRIVVGADGLRTCGPWVEKKDPKSGRSYFANTETKQRTWKIEETPFTK